VDVLGNVTVATGAGLMPAASSQAPVFNVTGNLVNSGTLTMRVTAVGVATKINKTAGTLNYGGDLAITGTGVGGTTYDMFDASAFTGSFSTVTTLGAGSNWYTGNLTTDGTVLLNRAPVPANPSVARGSGLTAKVLTNTLVATDADGHSITYSVSGTTTNGATVTVAGLYYTIPANTVNDAFTYTAYDAFGGTNTGVVSINITNTVGQTTGNVTLVAGNANLTFYGVPGTTYTVQRSTDLSTWTDLTTVTADSNGLVNYVDVGAPTPNAYYRLKF
jgi:hypothetical protein